MPDLRDLMHEAAGEVVCPSDDVVESDLSRGRRARARIARRRALVPAGLAAVAAGVLSLSLLGSGADPHPAQQSAPVAIALAAYSGAQPEGFRIAKVPAGWDLQSSTKYALLIAPEGLANQNPNEFDGKILVSVANPNELSVDRGQTHPLKVGDVTGTRFAFATGSEDSRLKGPPGLLVPDGPRTLIFQFPDDLDWDDATIAEFAAGVHATKDAAAAQG